MGAWIRTSCLCVATVIAPVQGQDDYARPFSLEEADKDGGRHAVPLHGGIVDINSTLDVTLDKDAIRRQIVESLSVKGFDDDQLKKLTQLHNWAMVGKDALPQVDQALRDLAASGKKQEDFIAFESAMDDAVRAAEDILLVALSDPALGQRIETRLDEAVDPSTLDQYEIVFEEAAVYAGTIRDSLDAVIQKEAIYISLGAWMKTKERLGPLHLAGFDVYPEGKHYKVPRWHIAPTEKQRQDIDSLQTLAAEFNAGDVGFKDILKKSAETSFSVVIEVADSCRKQLVSEFNSVRAIPEDWVDTIRAELDTLETSLKSYDKLVRRLVGKYKTGRIGQSGLTGWITGVTNDLKTVETDTKDLIRRFDHLAGSNGTLSRVRAVGGRTVSEADSLKTTVQECAETLKSQVVAMVNKLGATFGIVNASADIDAKSLSFSDKVTKHDIASLPTTASLDLNYTGKREGGDTVVFKLGAGRADSETTTTEEKPEELLTTSVRLFRVLAHVDTNVGLIFADPMDSTGVTRRFQGAPSYSVLLKWGSRRSRIYNQAINFGFGINVSALDFDKDDVLELGIAAVGSVFRDYVQIGYGYNVYDDTAYWFFGLQLPMPTIPFPGGGTGKD